mmetsp:Transcript_16648/g.51635  ORF Transcript_16648/g.51635 Transcript_16648/m.51635 type:complete len:250 (+) Transcript_16648:44-793(+)
MFFSHRLRYRLEQLCSDLRQRHGKLGRTCGRVQESGNQRFPETSGGLDDWRAGSHTNLGRNNRRHRHGTRAVAVSAHVSTSCHVMHWSGRNRRGNGSRGGGGGEADRGARAPAQTGEKGEGQMDAGYWYLHPNHNTTKHTWSSCTTRDGRPSSSRLAIFMREPFAGTSPLETQGARSKTSWLLSPVVQALYIQMGLLLLRAQCSAFCSLRHSHSCAACFFFLLSFYTHPLHSHASSCLSPTTRAPAYRH